MNIQLKNTFICPYCKTTKNRKLDNFTYCNECEIYLNNETNKFISSKYIKESIKTLCNDCKKNKQIILCNSFKEYYKKLKICKTCKNIFKENLKELFFRHQDLFKIRNTFLKKYSPNENNDYRLFLIFSLIFLLGYLHNSFLIYILIFFFTNIFKFNLFICLFGFLLLLFLPKYYFLMIFIEYFRLSIFNINSFKIPFLLNNDTEQLISAFNKLTIKEERGN